MVALTVIIDSLLFAGEGVTLGTSLPFSVIVGIAVGVIAFRAQMRWGGDDKESASIKAGILALLVAIPSPLGAVFYVPAGVLGFFRRNKN